MAQTVSTYVSQQSGTPGLSGLFDRYGSLLRFAPGAGIAGQGLPAASLYRVERGCVRSCLFSLDGDRNVLRFRQPGDIIGLGGERVWPASEEAVDAVAIRAVPREVFDAALARDTSLLAEIRADLAREVRAQADLIVLTANASAIDRVRIFLHRYAAVRSEPDAYTRLPMSRQDIADHLGLSVETVCRSITALKTHREIELDTATRFRLGPRRDAEGRFASAA